MRTTIVYEDRELIVACKPAGLATQTSRVGQADMVSELKNYLKGSYLGVVHRLDQPVEGLLAFGKTKEAAAALTRQLQAGSLHKNYYCVVCREASAPDGAVVMPEGAVMTSEGAAVALEGAVVASEGAAPEKMLLRDYLYKSADNRAEIVPESMAAKTGAKEAVLRYRILESLSPEVLLAEVCLETGRFHQIRAQMAHAGMPLLGDAKYGTEYSGLLSGKLGVRNVALCAYDLQLAHPKGGRKLHFRIVPQGDIFQKFSSIDRG